MSEEKEEDLDEVDTGVEEKGKYPLDEVHEQKAPRVVFLKVRVIELSIPTDFEDEKFTMK